MCKPTELSVQESRELLANPVYQTVKRFEVQQRMAQMYVQSTVIPDTFRGNIGNCVIAIDMAMRMQVNPLMVMQNLYVVHGNPAWSAKFLISCINASGRFAPLRYEWTGKPGTEQYGCRAYTYERSDRDHKERLDGIWVTIGMAKKEGWMSKNGSKWATMPDQMLIYRAAAFWQRAYAPEISMGFLTREEAEDGVTPADAIAEEVPAEEQTPERAAVTEALARQRSYSKPDPTDPPTAAPSPAAPSPASAEAAVPAGPPAVSPSTATNEGQLFPNT